MTTGNKPTAALQYPSLGSLAAKLLTTEKGVPPYVTFMDLRNGSAGQSGYLGTSYNPFIIEGNGAGRNGTFRVRGITLPNGITLSDLDQRDRLLSTFDESFRQIDARNELVEGLDTFHQQALDILRADKTQKAFDLQTESASLRERYGTTPFAAGALAARRLVEAGVRFVTVGIGGWDTHNIQANEQPPIIETLARNLKAFVDDLGDAHMRNVVILVYSEFVRTARENGNTGTDHGNATLALVVAHPSKINGRRIVHGAPGYAGLTDLRDDRDLKHSVDYRSLIFEAVSRHLGNSSPEIFPDYTPVPVGVFV